MDDDRERARRIAFGRFVVRARDQWLASDPSRTKGAFAAFVDLGTSTIDRWMKGQWGADPDRTSVDNFCARLHIDPRAAYAHLGWGLDAPVHATPEPQEDPDIVALARKLRNPNVPQSEKRHIRSTIRFLAGRPPVDDSDDTRDTGT